MPEYHFKELVLQAKDLGAETISIFGFGEPLVDKGLHKKVNFCTDNNLETFITTNGSLLYATEAFHLLDAGLSHIRFSAHGVKSVDYNRIHRGLNWDDVSRNIFNFLAIKKRYPDCKVSLTVIPENLNEIDRIIEFWTPYVDWLEIWRPHNWTNGRKYRKIAAKKKSCNRPFSGPVQINADGNMMVCCFDFDARLTVGNTYENTIEEILKGEAYEEIRRKHGNGDLSGLVCEKCDQLNIEDDSPLLYSNRDPERNLDTTSSTKFKIKEI